MPRKAPPAAEPETDVRPEDTSPSPTASPQEEASKALPVEVGNITLANGEKNILARTSITLGGCFKVRGVRLVSGQNGIFISMPSHLVNGRYVEDCCAVTSEMYQAIADAVLGGYKQALAHAAQAISAAQAAPSDAPAETVQQHSQMM